MNLDQPCARRPRSVIARSDSDEAIQSFIKVWDCFASLAMTRGGSLRRLAMAMGVAAR
jgi:hypothetical protein